MENCSKKKIILVTGIYPPDIGGPATYSKLLYDELPKFGYEVEVLSFGLVRKFPKIFRHTLFILKLCKNAYKFDFIFAQDTVSVGFPALLVSKLFRKKFLIRVPGDYAWEQSTQRFGVKESIDEFQAKKYGLKVEVLRWIQKFVVCHADVVITPSNYFRNLVKGWMKDDSKLHTIYNGVDFKSVGSKEECRNKLGISHNTTLIVTAGRLVPWKGFKAVISSVKKLANSISNLKLIILGDGPQRQELEDFIVGEKNKNLISITGNLDRSTLLSYLSASDIFVLNSSFESFSFQTVEAMYCGTGVIVSRIGSLPELIDDKVSGLLFEQNNTDDILSAMKFLIDNPSEKRNLAEQAIQKSHKFSIKNTISGLINFLK